MNPLLFLVCALWLIVGAILGALLWGGYCAWRVRVLERQAAARREPQQSWWDT